MIAIGSLWYNRQWKRVTQVIDIQDGVVFSQSILSLGPPHNYSGHEQRWAHRPAAGWGDMTIDKFSREYLALDTYEGELAYLSQVTTEIARVLPHRNSPSRNVSYAAGYVLRYHKAIMEASLTDGDIELTIRSHKFETRSRSSRAKAV